MVSADSLPRGRLFRFRQLAQVGIRTGLGLLGNSDASKSAAYAADVLGNLRGLAAKVGQMLSYVDGMVPEPHREVFEQSLTKLRENTPTSSFDSVRTILERSWGRPISSAVAEFDEIPFASASIGQVHRGRLHDGREVAIKVQHAGIAEAMEDDLRNIGLFEGMVNLAGGAKLDSKRVFAEVKTRLREELDYQLEATRQTAFARIHEHDPRITVPKVVSELSSKEVLVSELHRGATLEVACQRSPEERRAFAETLWTFVFRGNLVGGMFNADPHPGNYLFGEDGHIVFLDFGCVEPLTEVRVTRARAMHLAAIRGDDAQFVAHARELLGTQPGPYEEFVLDYTRKCFEPLFGSPFLISRSYVAGLVKGIKEMKALTFQKDARLSPLPKGMVFMNRLQFGFYSVLARLDTEVDYAGIETRFLKEAGVHDNPKPKS